MSNQPPALDYATPQPQRRRWFWPAFLSIVFATIVAILTFVDVAPRHGPRPVANQAKCQMNLRNIGTAIESYQSQNAGAYPPSFDALLTTTSLLPASLICGETSDEAADGPTTRAMLADLHRLGHLSYIHVGQGLTNTTATMGTVVAYEPLSNHDNRGMNILFGDGHAEWFDAKIGTQVIAAAGTGKRVHLSSTGVVSTTPVVTTTPTTALAPSTQVSPR